MGNCAFQCESKDLTLDLSDEALKPVMSRLTVEELHSFLATSEKIVLRSGNILVTQGDLADDLYILSKGSFDLSFDGKVVSKMKAEGQCIGISSFLHGEQHQQTVTAATRSTVYKLTRANFDKIALAVEKHFATIEILKLLSRGDRRLLYKHAKVVQFVKGEMVIMKGEMANQFYIILEGFISCENKMLVRGQYFGEDALMEKNGVYFADAEVVEDAFLLAVSAEGFHCPQFSAVRASLEKGVKRKRRRRKRLLKALKLKEAKEKSIDKPKESSLNILESIVKHVVPNLEAGAAAADITNGVEIEVPVTIGWGDEPLPPLQMWIAAGKVAEDGVDMQNIDDNESLSNVSSSYLSSSLPTRSISTGPEKTSRAHIKGEEKEKKRKGESYANSAAAGGGAEPTTVGDSLLRPGAGRILLRSITETNLVPSFLRTDSDRTGEHDGINAQRAAEAAAIKATAAAAAAADTCDVSDGNSLLRSGSGRVLLGALGEALGKNLSTLSVSNTTAESTPSDWNSTFNGERADAAYPAVAPKEDEIMLSCGIGNSLHSRVEETWAQRGNSTETGKGTFSSGAEPRVGEGSLIQRGAGRRFLRTVVDTISNVEIVKVKSTPFLK